MHTQPTDDYEKILLSFKEVRILRHIVKKKEAPICFCTDDQRDTLERYGLIHVDRDHLVIEYGVTAHVQGEPKRILPTDKAFRYFLYRKENRFKGKYQVIIAFLALIKACDTEICWLIHFIADYISNL